MDKPTNQPKFETVGDLIKDPIFIEVLSKAIENAKNAKAARPEPPKDCKYRRDWQDRLLAIGGEITPAFFLHHIPDVWNKTSQLSLELRTTVNSFAQNAYMETLKHYAEKEPKETVKPVKTKKATKK